MNYKKVQLMTQAAMIATLYAVLTLAANTLGLAGYAIQIRFSEALTILPYFTAGAVPGVTAGCLIANILTGGALPDIVFGTIATFLGGVGTYRLRGKSRWLAPVPPIAANAVIIPPMLYYAYGITPVWFSFVTVSIGEIICCGVMGMALQGALMRHKKMFVI